MPINYPIKFVPILKERIWGGEKLHTLIGKEAKNFPVGESWEISTIPGSVSVVANGELKGKSLQELIDTFTDDFLGKHVYEKFGTKFPLLVKYIDAHADLSVQLHPNDELAQKRHQCFGKEEMWYIMQADEDSRLLFGFNQKLSRESYRYYCKNNILPEVLHQEKVKKGDIFKIPAGRVHAIGAGIVLAEIQQASDITYRLFDWDRKDKQGKSRELRTELALDAIDFNIPKHFGTHYNTKENTYVPIVDSPYFKIQILELTTKKQIATTSKDSFIIYMCVAGKGHFYTEYHEVSISMGESILIPASFPKYTIKPDDTMTLLYIKAR